MTNSIKAKIISNNSKLNTLSQKGINTVDFEQLKVNSIELNDLITKSREDYYNRLAKKLSNPKTSPKAYWSILKSFFADKKIPIIPPLLVNDEFVTNFETKANIFNVYFANQCSLLQNGSVLPDHLNPLNNDALCDFEINDDIILKLIRELDENKAHGHDAVSIRMLKICDESIIKPLEMIYTNCLENGVFPDSWKKANIIPVHKKGDKCLITNYRPVSLLPICSKIFEKLIYNSLYKFLEDRNLLNPNQSGFRSGDSCINQLISITHDIYTAFDANPSLEVRGIFLDISKAFDRVWHDCLIMKLLSYGVKGKLIELIKKFLSNRYQRVLLNGKCSKWERIKAGVPQGSILGPLFFLIYINDLPTNLESVVKLFADDTSIFSVIKDPNLSSIILNNDLEKINRWAYQWKMSFNPDPTKQAQEIIFSRKVTNVHPHLYFNNTIVKRSNLQKILVLFWMKSYHFIIIWKIELPKPTKAFVC